MGASGQVGVAFRREGDLGGSSSKWLPLLGAVPCSLQAQEHFLCIRDELLKGIDGFLLEGLGVQSH